MINIYDLLIKNIDKTRVFVGDINELNKNFNAYKDFILGTDVVCGGPPCQGFSMANRQRIIDDPRNSLYKAFLEFLKSVKPKFFVMENVRGMAKKISEILIDFEQVLDKEYNIAYSILNARDYSVPQNRERLFVIGNRIGVASHLLFKNIKQQTYQKFTLGDAIIDLPELKPKRIRNSAQFESDDCGYTERDFDYTKTEFYKFINDDKIISKLYNHKNRYNNDRDINIFSLLPQGANSLHPAIENIMPYKNRNHIFKDKYYKLKVDEVCKTITSHMKHDCNMYIHPTQARGLSPREAARIQTFPDDYIFTGTQNEWYKQIGNAVPVKLAKIIGEEIYKCL